MTTRKEQIRNSKKKKAAKKGAEFQTLDDEDRKLINKTINDKRQNLIQALRSYFEKLLVVKQANKFQERFEKHILDGGEVKDHLGLSMSQEEKECEAQKSYIALRFARRDVIEQKKDLMLTWGIDEKQIEEYYEKWFIGNGKIE